MAHCSLARMVHTSVLHLIHWKKLLIPQERVMLLLVDFLDTFAPSQRGSMAVILSMILSVRLCIVISLVHSPVLILVLDGFVLCQCTMLLNAIGNSSPVRILT